MRLGLHFFEADTPPFCGSKTLEKSEIYQDLGRSEKHGIIIETEENYTLRLEEFEEMNVRLSSKT